MYCKTALASVGRGSAQRVRFGLRRDVVRHKYIERLHCDMKFGVVVVIEDVVVKYRLKCDLPLMPLS